MDRRDKVLRAISRKAAQTMGTDGKLSPGFCRPLYARAAGLNQHMAREVARQIFAFAASHGVKVLVFEDLRHFRPKGGRKKSDLRQKFHGWLHRALVQQVQQTAEEKGIEVDLVFPRGTSAWAYDGSGRVIRDKFNYSRCAFRSGKQYDCDLSASYNIAARWFAWRHKTTPVGGKTDWPARGKRTTALRGTTAGPRTPVTLSTLWAVPQDVAA